MVAPEKQDGFQSALGDEVEHRSITSSSPLTPGQKRLDKHPVVHSLADLDGLVQLTATELLGRGVTMQPSKRLELTPVARAPLWAAQPCLRPLMPVPQRAYLQNIRSFISPANFIPFYIYHEISLRDILRQK